MPADALPQPWAAIPDLAHYERSYLDMLGRPMNGAVRVSGGQRSEHGGTVIVAAGVEVKLAAGRLVVDLPPGDYQLEAALVSLDGVRAKETNTVTLTSGSSHVHVD